MPMADVGVQDLHSPRMRSAGRDPLSLALMDARNHSLRWIALFEAAVQEASPASQSPPSQPLSNPLRWHAGHLGWYAEHWIARNVQRQRGTHCDPGAIRMASIEPHADRWYEAVATGAQTAFAPDLPDLDATRQYLAATMEITLDLLDAAGDDDDALYFFRRVLFHEDAQAEAFAVMAQTLDVAVPQQLGLVKPLAALPQRGPLVFPATRATVGSPPGGFVFDNEKWAHEIDVPEFEIDAQAVNWAQYAEFVEDGGYDERRWWSDAGWDWLQMSGRRVPRHVEQLRHGVLQRRFGSAVRVPLTQAAVHVSGHEAEAWCRWAGRRLPSEVEWECAARQGVSRGFRWGDVREWTGTTFRPYPGFEPDPDAAFSQGRFGTQRVLRGASHATHGRLRHASHRHAEKPEADAGFHGFRSCTV